MKPALLMCGLVALSCASVLQERRHNVVIIDSSFPPEYVEAIVGAQEQWIGCLDEQWTVDFVLQDTVDGPGVVNGWVPNRERGKVLATTTRNGPTIYLPADQLPHQLSTVALHELGHFWGIRGEATHGTMAATIGQASPVLWESDCIALRYWMMGEGDDPVTDGTSATERSRD